MTVIEVCEEKLGIIYSVQHDYVLIETPSRKKEKEEKKE